jgi:hypothetical protein
MIDSSFLYHKQDPKGFSNARQRKSHVSALTSHNPAFHPTSELLLLLQPLPKYAA